MGPARCGRLRASSVLLFLVAIAPLSRAAIDPKTLRCLVCRATIDEFETAISKLNPKQMVEVGNYRLDETGNVHQNKVPLSKSQVHLSEMLDDVCKKMSDYVRVRFKATQKLAVMKMLSETGGMNPDFSYTDFVTDEDLNKSLEFYCEGIVGENEDQLVEIYTKRPGNTLPDGKTLFCKDQLDLCEDSMLPTDEDRDWNLEKERSRGGGGNNPYGMGMGMGMGMDMPPQDFNNEYPDIEDDPEEEDVGELELQTNDREEL